MRKSGEYRRFRRKYLKIKHYEAYSETPRIIRHDIWVTFLAYKLFNTPYWEGRAIGTDDSLGVSRKDRGVRR